MPARPNRCQGAFLWTAARASSVSPWRRPASAARLQSRRRRPHPADTPAAGGAYRAATITRGPRRHPVAKWALERGEPQQTGRVMTDPFPLSALPAIRTRGIAGTNGRFFPVAFMDRLVRNRLGVEPAHVAAGHLPARANPPDRSTCSSADSCPLSRFRGGVEVFSQRATSSTRREELHGAAGAEARPELRAGFTDELARHRSGRRTAASSPVGTGCSGDISSEPRCLALSLTEGRPVQLNSSRADPDVLW